MIDYCYTVVARLSHRGSSTDRYDFYALHSPSGIPTRLFAKAEGIRAEHSVGRAATTHVFLLTPWSRVLPEKLKHPELPKKFPAFYGTQRFITAFTRARHLSLSWARSIQSMPPHPTSRSSILILSSHLRLGLPSGLLPSGFPTKAMYAPLLSAQRANCPPHHSLLHMITRMIFGEEYRA
jgi:hypothetical protein